MRTIYPVGTDISIQEKLSWAHRLYRDHGRALASDRGVSSLLSRYREPIQDTWELMEETGVVAECTVCATEDGGSCCGAGIEDRFDAVLLLVNLLLGAELPGERRDPEGCFFLGDRGCSILARHTICVNYLCKRLQGRLSAEALHRLQAGIGREVDAAFVLEEGIKKWLTREARRTQGG